MRPHQNGEYFMVLDSEPRVEADIDCGVRYSIAVWFKDGKWQNGPYQTQECTPG